MDKKHFLVTNNTQGSYCIAGSKRIVIPAQCEDFDIAFPAATAATTVARLKQMYPMLSIKAASSTKSKAKTEEAKPEAAKPEAATPAQATPANAGTGETEKKADNKK